MRWWITQDAGVLAVTVYADIESVSFNDTYYSTYRAAFANTLHNNGIEMVSFSRASMNFPLWAIGITTLRCLKKMSTSWITISRDGRPLAASILRCVESALSFQYVWREQSSCHGLPGDVNGAERTGIWQSSCVGGGVTCLPSLWAICCFSCAICSSSKWT